MKKTYMAILVALGLVLGTSTAANAMPTIGNDVYSTFYGPYVDLDRLDQGAVTSGAAAGVSAAICIQTSGWACPTIAVVLTAAAFYIALNGYCPNKLRLYPRFGGFPMRCV
ncbi:hypothetical protein [Pseudarthrobacter scleromae]|uniref:hypothetical protein n=1 Tax=Pseudarthrobacter scleromae TaxID=158897 RepID=UPI003D00D12F